MVKLNYVKYCIINFCDFSEIKKCFHSKDTRSLPLTPILLQIFFVGITCVGVRKLLNLD